MKGSRLNPYLHEYEFPHHDYLLHHFEYLQSLFSKGIEKQLKENTNNVFLNEGPVYDFINSKLIEVITENYHVSSPFSHSSIGVYLQTNEQFISTYHNHISSSDITCILYINPPPPGTGGELQCLTEVLEDAPIVVKPQVNKLYVLPSWVYHRPIPQTHPSPRISLNWGYNSSIRPIHKITGDRW